MINVANIRFGHATNSSSLHSIIISGTSQYSVEGYDGNEFGQQNFLLDTYHEKMRYLAQILGSTIAAQRNIFDHWADLSESDGAEIKKKVDACLGGDYFKLSGYVDHQSDWMAALRMNGDIDFAFFSEFAREFASDKTVAIEGGSDGDLYELRGTPHERWNGILRNIVMNKSGSISRKDGDWWTIFDQNNGAKMRFSFLSKPKPYVHNRPELVDVKITDKCNHGCKFCYQSSTGNGRFAEYGYLCNIIDWAADNSIFEVALGGGDPILHPKFLDILAYGAKKNVSVSFSTKSIGWLELKHPGKTEKFLQNCKAYGVSVGTVGDVKAACAFHHKLIEFGEKHSLSSYKSAPRLVLQFIPEYYGLARLKSIYREIARSTNAGPAFYFSPPTLLLLGFKHVGNGENIKHKSIPGWSIILRSIMNKRFDEDEVNIAIDTLFAQRYPDDMKHIYKECYYTQEGVHSLYIDALKSVVAKSSFDPKTYNYTCLDQILPIFQKWNGVKNAVKTGVV